MGLEILSRHATNLSRPGKRSVRAGHLPPGVVVDFLPVLKYNQLVSSMLSKRKDSALNTYIDKQIVIEHCESIVVVLSSKQQ